MFLNQNSYSLQRTTATISCVKDVTEKFAASHQFLTVDSLLAILGTYFLCKHHMYLRIDFISSQLQCSKVDQG